MVLSETDALWLLTGFILYVIAQDRYDFTNVGRLSGSSGWKSWFRFWNFVELLSIGLYASSVAVFGYKTTGRKEDWYTVFIALSGVYAVVNRKIPGQVFGYIGVSRSDAADKSGQIWGFWTQLIKLLAGVAWIFAAWYAFFQDGKSSELWYVIFATLFVGIWDLTKTIYLGTLAYGSSTIVGIDEYITGQIEVWIGKSKAGSRRRMPARRI